MEATTTMPSCRDKAHAQSKFEGIYKGLRFVRAERVSRVMSVARVSGGRLDA